MGSFLLIRTLLMDFLDNKVISVPFYRVKNLLFILLLLIYIILNSKDDFYSSCLISCWKVEGTSIMKMIWILMKYLKLFLTGNFGMDPYNNG